MTEFTPDQNAAITARGENILLSAAAGSGKTTVLVERVLSLIGEGANIDEMLIVTFSRAATADMKRKLSEKLLERADNPLYRAQFDRLERANVSTLHSFCTSVLRAHFEAVDVDPAFRVLDDPEANQLKARATQAVLDDAVTSMPGPLSALECGRSMGKLAGMIVKLHEFAQSRPDMARWLKYHLTVAPRLGVERWTAAIVGEMRRHIAEACAYYRHALSQKDEPFFPGAYLALLNDELQMLSSMRALDDAAFVARLNALSFDKLPSKRIPKDDPNTEALKAYRTRVKDLRDTAKDRVAKAVKSGAIIDRAAADTRLNQPALDALYMLVVRFDAQFAALKAERSALTYGDLEVKALGALSIPHIARRLREKYTHLFIDEYQDVSDVQEAIIGRIARADNVFMVGDVKQSIYRFRQAEPTLFIEKYNRYGAASGGRLIALKANFRSRARILGFVNRVFERAMSGPDAEVQYDEAAYLSAGQAFAGDDPPIEMHLIAPDEAAPDDEDEEKAELHASEREGVLVAERIRALLSTTLPGEGRLPGEDRPVRPRDIAVLGRTRGAIVACARMLRDAGIPAYADVDGGYFETLEVRIMLSLLEVVGNRRRDYPLLSVLRSPIVGLTTSELARIRAAHPEGSFRDAVLDYLPREDDLAKTLRAFEAKLDHYRMLSRALPLSDLVDHLLRDTGFYAYAGSMKNGGARQGNLDLLCAYASQYESAQAGGLNGFLAYVQAIVAQKGDMGSAHALGAGDDVVTLMTTHKSKGLEFPIVFAIGLGRNLAGAGSQEELKLHRTLGVGLKVHDARLTTQREGVIRKAIDLVARHESIEEEKRVLYVLLTRAKHQLIMVGSVKKQGDALTRWALAREASLVPGTALDIIMQVAEDDPDVDVFWSDGSGRAQSQRAAAAESAPDAGMIEAARRALSWRYPYADEAFLPVKLTVSGLTHAIEGAHQAPAIARRPRFLTGERLTATERGTLTHNALSAVELKPLEDLRGAALHAEVARQLRALYDRGVLVEAVDPRAITAFFERDIGRRLLRARDVHREWPFNLRMTVREALGRDSEAELMVQGVIDCCFIEDGAWVLLDYKTDRPIEESVLAERYRAQLTMYRHALERITGTPVKQTLLCLLGMGREVEIH